MVDPLQPDRLLRKRNRNLQKQLDITMQILSEEYRQCRERIYKEERDCGRFLQSLYNTVPDLQNYGQPDTRTMNAAAILRQRRYSLSTPAELGTSAPSAGIPHYLQHSAHDLRSSTSSAAEGGGWNRNHGVTASRSKVYEKRWSVTDDLDVEPFRRDSQGRDNKEMSITTTTTRPRTADAQKAQHSTHPDQQPPRSKTNFAFRKFSGPSFGKSAYLDQDRSAQETVLKKFQVIFDPDVNKRTASTISTPAGAAGRVRSDSILSADDKQSSSTDDANDPESDCDGSGVQKEHKDDGQESNTPHKLHDRRVVWSACPHRKTTSVSAPDVNALLRPASETGPSDVHVRSKPRSLSVSLPSGSHRTPDGPGFMQHSSLEPKIRALALRRSMSISAEVSHHCTEPRSPSESYAHSGSKGSHSQHHTTVCEAGIGDRLGKSKVGPAARYKSEPDNFHVHQRKLSFSHVKTRPSSQANGPLPSAQAVTRRHSTVTPLTRRLSEANVAMISDLTPEQLVAKLMNAGRSPGIQPRRPKTAPSKSELSRRLVPVSRQTIVGILSEIENQKACTRTLVSTSKELQEMVNSLVPLETPVDDSD